MQSKQIGPIFNLSPLKKTTQIYFGNKSGAYQRAYFTPPFPVTARPGRHRGR
jgi:hypothetical protein